MEKTLFRSSSLDLSLFTPSASPLFRSFRPSYLFAPPFDRVGCSLLPCGTSGRAPPHFPPLPLSSSSSFPPCWPCRPSWMSAPSPWSLLPQPLLSSSSGALGTSLVQRKSRSRRSRWTVALGGKVCPPLLPPFPRLLLLDFRRKPRRRPWESPRCSSLVSRWGWRVSALPCRYSLSVTPQLGWGGVQGPGCASLSRNSPKILVPAISLGG